MSSMPTNFEDLQVTLKQQTRLRKQNVRHLRGPVREVRGVFGFHSPEKGRLDVLGHQQLSKLILDVNRCLEAFDGNELIQQPIGIIEFNSMLPDQEKMTRAKVSPTYIEPPTAATLGETALWKSTGGLGLYEARYEAERLLFRGIFGEHDKGVGKNEQRLLGKLQASLAAIIRDFQDTDWLRLDCLTVLFNPMEVQVNQALSPKTELNHNPIPPLLQPVKPRFRWGAAQLDVRAEKNLEDFLYEVENRDDLVANRYGDTFPKAASLLALEGPPGTGKTTLASGIADRLGMQIIEISYAAIENSLVGEAAKTIKRLFSIARETGAVIFIDECDSLVSHRPTSFSQGADYHVSSLRSELFTEISNFDGVLIVATNNAEAYDKAFVSRIYQRIEMPLPNEKLRRRNLASVLAN